MRYTERSHFFILIKACATVSPALKRAVLKPFDQPFVYKIFVIKIEGQPAEAFCIAGANKIHLVRRLCTRPVEAAIFNGRHNFYRDALVEKGISRFLGTDASNARVASLLFVRRIDEVKRALMLKKPRTAVAVGELVKMLPFVRFQIEIAKIQIRDAVILSARDK